jgi:hypothetical protein
LAQNRAQRRGEEIRRLVKRLERDLFDILNPASSRL